MVKPKVLVFSGYGLNSEEETRYAFDWAGGSTDIVHINDIIDGRFSMLDYQVLAFPGGFAYGDDTGSGNAYANKVRNHLWEKLIKFIKKDKLVIGICNGFQIIANLGLFSARVALMHNDSGRYTVRFVDLKVESNISPWLKNIDTLSIPVAHGEGKFYAEEDVLDGLKKRGLIALRYFRGEMCEYQNLPVSPNGAIDNIAGITDETGRIFGLMPHPERAMFFTQMPNWPLLNEIYKRQGKKIPKEGPGLKIFQNAIDYFV